LELVVRNEWGRREEGGLELKQALFISSISVKQKLASHRMLRGHQRKNHKRQVLALHQHYIMRLFSQTIVTRAYDSVVTPRD